MTTTQPVKQGPGRPPIDAQVAKVHARAQAAQGTTGHRGRPSKEDLDENPSPVKSNLYCGACQQPIHLPDLLPHAAEHNRAVAHQAELRRRRQLQAQLTHGNRKRVDV